MVDLAKVDAIADGVSKLSSRFDVMVDADQELVARAKRVLAMKEKEVARYEEDYKRDPTAQGADLLRRAKEDLRRFKANEYQYSRDPKL